MGPVSHGFLNVEKEAKDRARVTNTKTQRAFAGFQDGGGGTIEKNVGGL